MAFQDHFALSINIVALKLKNLGSVEVGGKSQFESRFPDFQNLNFDFEFCQIPPTSTDTTFSFSRFCAMNVIESDK